MSCDSCGRDKPTVASGGGQLCLTCLSGRNPSAVPASGRAEGRVPLTLKPLEAPAEGRAELGEMVEDSPLPDPLAKDLPGLPIRAKGFVFDETGFHTAGILGHRPFHLRWSDITEIRHVMSLWNFWFCGAIFYRPDVIHVEGQSDKGKPVSFRRIAGDEVFRRIGEAWREYLLRRAEGTGLISGTTLRVAFAGLRYSYFWLITLCCSPRCLSSCRTPTTTLSKLA